MSLIKTILDYVLNKGGGQRPKLPKCVFESLLFWPFSTKGHFWCPTYNEGQGGGSPILDLVQKDTDDF